MGSFDHILSRFCGVLSLDRAALCALLAAPAGALDDLDALPPDHALQMLDRCARVAGLSLSELLSGRLESGLQVLYRRMGEDAPSLPERAARLGALGHQHRAIAIGGFARDLATVARLRSSTHVTLPAWATSRPVVSSSSPAEQGRALAAEVRERLGLGDAPIESVWSLAAALGVSVAAVTPDDLSASISGVSWRVPAPALVVNLVGGRGQWWRTRMTVAHELAHVLFDLPEWGAVVSAEEDSGPLYWAFERIEQRANAFAAYLLCPPARVAELGRTHGLTPGTVGRVCQLFGVGYETAVHTLCHVMEASPAVRTELLLRRGDRPLSFAQHPDEHGTPSTPREQAALAVRLAYAEGRLSGVDARALLDIPLTSRLPDGWPSAEPVVGRHAHVRSIAARKLRQAGQAGVVAVSVELSPAGGYRVVCEDPRGTEQVVTVDEVELSA